MKTLKEALSVSEALFSRKNINKNDELILKFEDGYYLNVLYVRFEGDQFEFVYEFEKLNYKDEAEKTDPVYLDIDTSKKLLEKLKTTVNGVYTLLGKKHGMIRFRSYFRELEVIDNHISKFYVTEFSLSKDHREELIEFLEKHIK